MKKISLFLVALFTLTIVNAQTNAEEIDLIQSAFGMEKKAMIAEFVQVDAAQKDAFWALYDEYETARKDLGKKRIELLNKYAENYDNLTEEFADSWTKEILSLTKSTDKLLVSYYNKIKKATSAVVALQWWQVEGYILSGIRFSILESVPFPEKK